MLLVIDIGNTNLVLGVFVGKELKHSWRVVTRRDQSVDEYAVLCRNFFRLEDLSHEQVSGVVISSVVPPLNEAFQLLARKYFSVEPIFVEPAGQTLMPIRYDSPSEVGADRIVAALAAFDKLGGPAIVVDFGTATTFDAISARGEYLGGIIAPGIGISAEALHRRAAKLPHIEIKKPSSVIGNSTEASMQSGLYFGYLGLVEGILTRMTRELGDCKVVATGGQAHLVAAGCALIDDVEEDLMLYGLKIYYDRLNDKS